MKNLDEELANISKAIEVNIGFKSEMISKVCLIIYTSSNILGGTDPEKKINAYLYP